MHYVYAISSLSRRYIYVGISVDVDRRFREHASGKSRTTRPYAPFILLMVEASPTRLAARRREKFWKSGAGKEKLYRILARKG